MAVLLSHIRQVLIHIKNVFNKLLSFQETIILISLKHVIIKRNGGEYVLRGSARQDIHQIQYQNDINQ